MDTKFHYLAITFLALLSGYTMYLSEGERGLSTFILGFVVLWFFNNGKKGD